MLQQNDDIIKVENGVDVLSEDDSIGVKTDEVYISSAVTIKEDEPNVSFIFS
jgi:hypothetical protein